VRTKVSARGCGTRTERRARVRGRVLSGICARRLAWVSARRANNRHGVANPSRPPHLLLLPRSSSTTRQRVRCARRGRRPLTPARLRGHGPNDSSSTASAKNSSANVAHLLAALPSAAAPEGTAVLSRGGAFVRGVCIVLGDSESSLSYTKK
jgi:hypothetical protein